MAATNTTNDNLDKKTYREKVISNLSQSTHIDAEFAILPANGNIIAIHKSSFDNDLHRSNRLTNHTAIFGDLGTAHIADVSPNALLNPLYPCRFTIDNNYSDEENDVRLTQASPFMKRVVILKGGKHLDEKLPEIYGLNEDFIKEFYYNLVTILNKDDNYRDDDNIFSTLLALNEFENTRELECVDMDAFLKNIFMSLIPTDEFDEYIYYITYDTITGLTICLNSFLQTMKEFGKKNEHVYMGNRTYKIRVNNRNLTPDENHNFAYFCNIYHDSNKLYIDSNHFDEIDVYNKYTNLKYYLKHTHENVVIDKNSTDVKFPNFPNKFITQICQAILFTHSTPVNTPKSDGKSTPLRSLINRLYTMREINKGNLNSKYLRSHTSTNVAGAYIVNKLNQNTFSPIVTASYRNPFSSTTKSATREEINALNVDNKAENTANYLSHWLNTERACVTDSIRNITNEKNLMKDKIRDVHFNDAHVNLLTLFDPHSMFYVSHFEDQNPSVSQLLCNPNINIVDMILLGFWGDLGMFKCCFRNTGLYVMSKPKYNGEQLDSYCKKCKRDRYAQDNTFCWCVFVTLITSGLNNVPRTQTIDNDFVMEQCNLVIDTLRINRRDQHTNIPVLLRVNEDISTNCAYGSAQIQIKPKLFAFESEHIVDDKSDQLSKPTTPVTIRLQNIFEKLLTKVSSLYSDNLLQDVEITSNEYSEMKNYLQTKIPTYYNVSQTPLCSRKLNLKKILYNEIFRTNLILQPIQLPGLYEDSTDFVIYPINDDTQPCARRSEIDEAFVFQHKKRKNDGCDNSYLKKSKLDINDDYKLIFALLHTIINGEDNENRKLREVYKTIIRKYDTIAMKRNLGKAILTIFDWDSANEFNLGSRVIKKIFESIFETSRLIHTELSKILGITSGDLDNQQTHDIKLVEKSGHHSRELFSWLDPANANIISNRHENNLAFQISIKRVEKEISRGVSSVTKPELDNVLSEIAGPHFNRVRFEKLGAIPKIIPISDDNGNCAEYTNDDTLYETGNGIDMVFKPTHELITPLKVLIKQEIFKYMTKEMKLNNLKEYRKYNHVSDISGYTSFPLVRDNSKTLRSKTAIQSELLSMNIQWRCLGLNEFVRNSTTVTQDVTNALHKFNSGYFENRLVNMIRGHINECTGILVNLFDNIENILCVLNTFPSEFKALFKEIKNILRNCTCNNYLEPILKNQAFAASIHALLAIYEGFSFPGTDFDNELSLKEDLQTHIHVLLTAFLKLTKPNATDTPPYEFNRSSIIPADLLYDNNGKYVTSYGNRHQSLSTIILPFRISQFLSENNAKWYTKIQAAYRFDKSSICNRYINRRAHSTNVSLPIIRCLKVHYDYTKAICNESNIISMLDSLDFSQLESSLQEKKLRPNIFIKYLYEKGFHKMRCNNSGWLFDKEEFVDTVSLYFDIANRIAINSIYDKFFTTNSTAQNTTKGFLLNTCLYDNADEANCTFGDVQMSDDDDDDTQQIADIVDDI